MTRTSSYRSGRASSLALALLLAALSTACGDDDVAQADSGHDAAADADTDTDVDTDTDADAGTDGGSAMTPADYDDPTPVEWVELDGGTYLQGNTSNLAEYYHETPAHDVTVPSFQMMKTEVTCSQYAQCVLDGACDEPLVAILDYPDASNCNWLVWGRNEHPVNCLNVYEAGAYCAWLGGRLPSESEWEYAARSRGKDNEYPWGADTPSCDYAVMYSVDGVGGCGTGHTWPVCSKPLGNTEQGLCDMAGNVMEWMPDCFYADYNGAPTDGSAWVIGSCEDQVLRGGNYLAPGYGCRTRLRAYNPSFGRGDYMGFRCAKDAE